MLCKSFDELTIVEKVKLIGKLNHLVQTYEGAFIEAKSMIDKAEKEGLFEDVVILPEKTEDNEHTERNSTSAE